MPILLLTGILVFSLAACRSQQAFAPEEVLRKSMHASTTLSAVSYAVHAAHTAENGERTDVLLEGELRRDAQQHNWHIRVERNGAFIGSASGASINDPYLLPLPTALLMVMRDRGQTQWNNRTVYLYDVALRNEAGDLLDALAGQSSFPALRFTGTLWIDAESFLLRRSTWDVVSQTSDERMKLDIVINDEDAAPAMLLPVAADERPPHDRASVERIFDAIPPSLSLLLGRPKDAEGMP